jgi:hypothetical protein
MRKQMAKSKQSEDGLSVAESFVVRATDAAVDLTTELLSGTDPSSALAKAAAKFGLSITIDAGLGFARGRARSATGRLESATAIDERDGLALFEKQAREALNRSADAERLGALLQDHQFWRLQRNYELEWLREPMEERRRMLEFAAASAVNLTLRPGELSRVERTLRELDPSDVQLLHMLNSIDNLDFLPDPKKTTPAAEQKEWDLTRRRFMLAQAHGMSRSVLEGAACIRMDFVAYGGPTCILTEPGHVVLSVLGGYIAASSETGKS